MIMMFDVDFNQVEMVKVELNKLQVELLKIEETLNGNFQLTVLADSKHQVLSIADLYFG